MTPTIDADLEVHLPVSAQPSVGTPARLAGLAEELGYRRAWLPETWGRDAVTMLALTAERTDAIGIGSSIVPVYSRSAALLGQTAATLQEASDGRFRLGVGPSAPAVVEGWHGRRFERPLRYTRETVEIVKQVLSGEQVEYDGDFFTLSGFRLRSDPPADPPAVDVAAMGPTAVEMAGRFADGWHATLFTPDGLRDRVADLRRGADLGDRDPDDVRVMLSLSCCALDDADRARRLAREHAAFYVGAMGTYYRDSLARQGYEEEANAIAAAWASGDRERARELVAEIEDDLGAAGSPEHAREQVARFASVEGVDAIAVGFPRGANLEDVEGTLEALAPAET